MTNINKLAEEIYSTIEKSGLNPTDVLDELISINSKMQNNKEEYESFLFTDDYGFTAPLEDW